VSDYEAGKRRPAVPTSCAASRRRLGRIVVRLGRGKPGQSLDGDVAAIEYDDHTTGIEANRVPVDSA
jgi:hypothetical protein